ncbi:MAG TPA: PKD domain-containing protein [Bacteroidales bacterium]|nr:PKD domain-containing protein [Bacteroidales bacterium]HNS47445.1 PKD domain-containing protein [Bacteroidales bacterium]
MKRNLSYITLVLTTFLFLTGCNEWDLDTPAASTIANFEFQLSNNGYAPCEALFTNLSLNAEGYSWDFGNGQTSNETSPTIQYDEPGLYSVTLTCTPVNDVYYNMLKKTLVVNVKDPLAGFTQVFYYTTRGQESIGHMVIMTDDSPVVQDFEVLDMDLTRPYGFAADTAHGKVYVADFSSGVIFQFSADGKNPVKILDKNVAGQEIVGDPEGMFVFENKLYWGRTGGIYRCNLDGTDPEEYINTGGQPPEFPIDMQIDPISRKIYLVNDKADFTGGFFTVNLDGSGLTEVIEDVDGCAIEVDFTTSKVYMALYPSDEPPIEGGIYMCNLDGTALSKIGETGSKATWGVTIDHSRQKLFWGYKVSNSALDGKIVRSNLDGSQPEDWLTGVSPHSMEVAWIKL